MAGKAGRGGAGAGARLFEIRIAGEKAVQMHGVIRAAEAVWKGRLAGADDILVEYAGGSALEVFEGGAHLLFQVALCDLRQFVRHRGGALYVKQ